MKNYRVGFKKGGNVTDASVGPWKEKQKPKPGNQPGPRKPGPRKPGPKPEGRREKLKKGRDFMEDPYRRKGRDPSREGREAPKPKPDPYRRGWEKLPQPKWEKPIGKFPPEKGKWEKPIGKFPPEKGKWQAMKEGGRTGLKKGGPKPGTYDYFLLHKREKKAEGGRSTKISKRGPVYNKNTGRKIIR